MSQIHNIDELIKLKKILEYRKEKVPWDIFHLQINELWKIYSKLKSDHNDNFLEKIRKFMIINLVTALEIYLRDTFILFVDRLRIHCDNLLSDAKEHSLLDLKAFASEEVSIGILLSNRYKFQNLKSIDKAFSDLLGIRIFKKIREYKLQSSEGAYFIINPDFYEGLDELIALRHRLIHLQPKIKIGDDKFIDLYNNVHNFVDLLSYFLMEEFIIKNKDKFDGELISLAPE